MVTVLPSRHRFPPKEPEKSPVVPRLGLLHCAHSWTDHENAHTWNKRRSEMEALAGALLAPVFGTARGQPLWVGAKMGQWLSYSMKVGELRVEVSRGEIIVREPVIGFCAIYSKPADRTQLKLKYWTETENYYELLARAWRAANTKARELGWIV
jgi:hypothetical protein